MPLLENARAFCGDVIATIEKKNADYAGESASNSYRNFDLAAEVHGVTAQEVISQEITKKAIRLANLVKQANYVPGEPRRDALRDIIGYALILESLDTDEAAQSAAATALYEEQKEQHLAAAASVGEANAEGTGAVSALKSFIDSLRGV